MGGQHRLSEVNNDSELQVHLHRCQDKEAALQVATLYQLAQKQFVYGSSA